MRDVQASVRAVEQISHNVYSATLNVGDADFIAGQYLMIILPSGEHVPYSIGSGPSNLPELTLYILVSEETSLAAKVMAYLSENAVVNIKMAGGDCHIENGALDLNADNLLMIAGGTGFSQIKSFYDDLIARNYSGKVSLYWGIRTEKDVFMKEWLEETQKKALFDFHVVVNECSDEWAGRKGWLYEAILQDHPDLSNSAAYICGSVAMVYGTLDELEKAGLDEKRCYSDVFAYAPRNK
ncbi:NAD(P)H-flavin reductase [Marinomonas mediterranea]|uniref:Oxidoreductase FAD/NAD(P)-binding domain protein n=1 Tax=Marinomonas mediterranea (strain ATCC 700492 / JCM 21426 / NBRC 103028 / MMB-1) TaxID=717774 RepID=F2JTQ5_MARM1|nr:NAD(P)H-flavin reductase [Marinomonas mediterranea]ADZ92675.1 oxidoreductase FAD/NAD(P)-binding domain protein [Marinomonas mediterranea MMB-1]WCN10611.1 NAD(P)H-flavin reductase [Marinomonas mediterranea]WCN18706.1 NAD(P)H-flavin reductase [Marinomonas mediterranea MMB-1]